jgi:hypothetical protein
MFVSCVARSIRDERVRRIEHSVNALITEAFVLGFTATKSSTSCSRARELDPRSRSIKAKHTRHETRDER